jgi:hypothetical protein
LSLGSRTNVFLGEDSKAVKKPRKNNGNRFTIPTDHPLVISHDTQFLPKLDKKLKSLSFEKLRSVLLQTDVFGKNAEEATSWQWVAGLNPGIKRSTLVVFPYGHYMHL